MVLTAGAYGTPAVLLRSGIGPAGELRALGIEVVADNPGVGANLHDHPSFELIFERTGELDRRDAAFVASGHGVPDEQGFAKVASSLCRSAPFDLHLFSEMLTESRPGIFVACLTPRSRGRVTLTGTDPEAPPRIDHGLLNDPDGHDLAVLVEGASLAGEFASRPELAALLGAQMEPAPGADLADAIQSAVIHCWHPVGTCAMGIACDERGRVYGVEGLVVADASLFPQTVRATTNLPAVVAGERVGEWLV